MFYIVLHCAVIKRQVNHVQFSLFFTGNSSVPNICAWNTIPFFSFCNAFHFTYQHQMTMMMMMCMKISGGSDNQSSPILVGYEGKHDHCLLLDLQYQTIPIPYHTIPWYINSSILYHTILDHNEPTKPHTKPPILYLTIPNVLFQTIPYHNIPFQIYHTIIYQTMTQRPHQKMLAVESSGVVHHAVKIDIAKQVLSLLHCYEIFPNNLNCDFLWFDNNNDDDDCDAVRHNRCHKLAYHTHRHHLSQHSSASHTPHVYCKNTRIQKQQINKYTNTNKKDTNKLAYHTHSHHLSKHSSALHTPAAYLLMFIAKYKPTTTPNTQIHNYYKLDTMFK